MEILIVSPFSKLQFASVLPILISYFYCVTAQLNCQLSKVRLQFPVITEINSSLMQHSIQLGKSEFQTSVMENYFSQLSVTDVFA